MTKGDGYHYIKYNGKIVFVAIEWIFGRPKIVDAKLIKAPYNEYYDDFPYERTTETIDIIEGLLK
jgi:hypothetical protein